ncbi:Uu.00g064760.m01.CDS01 [Anthostomella pinea]|uniref:protein-tyrosine-phosphatase n=1 Tax=Anthostomella pinea TaxID=933095 RepID=A0AAI8YN87_9PEZI|nr:Uu.00g064760.m01.CDS01 [Anthostomella pinea]
MAPDATRNNDRAAAAAAQLQHYTMKTSSRPALGSSHSHSSRPSQGNLQSLRANMSTTPMASPRMPHSVGQPYPPSAKLSPGMPAAAAMETRSPSPNYFGLSMERQDDLRDSAAAPLDNWSPPTSSVKSFGAAIPKQMPLNANPEFEAFRRQADANRTNTFSLGGSHFAPSSAALRPIPQRRPTNQSDAASELSLPRSSNSKARDAVGCRMDVDADSLHDSAYVSSDSKRNSEASLNPMSLNMPRFESPAHAESPFESIRRTTLSRVEDRHPRLSLPQNKVESSGQPSKPRSETLPANMDNGEPGLIHTSQLKEMLHNTSESEFMLLDVRVSTHYAQSRIRGALNLCIPTTLLKRATFNLEKLQKTLQIEEDQEKFAQWSTVKHLIVYDASSSEQRDAVAAMNMLKKFTNEGFSGSSYLLKGGFHAFAAAYPAFVDHQHAAERGGTSVTSAGGGRPSFAPVIGGVMLPTASSGANPFFSNIRQNMDLADGVGQMDIAVPPNADLDTMPRWLRDAANPSDHGKKVSERFLKIERSEQSRMRAAYAAFNASTPSASGPGKVQLSGVEKGVKNRYKDILPFEHARVRLAHRADGTCDYINASHIQASRSHKRYIAAQGPLPATFEDFWSVVWDQDVRVVAMLTAEQEGGQLKCHPYWRGREFGAFRLRPLSEKKISLDIDKNRSSSSASSASGASDSGRRRANTTTTLDSAAPPAQPAQPTSEVPYVIVRKFALSHTAHPFAPIREITHLHYPSWPDFGTPAQPSHLLALVELANVMQRSALPVESSTVTAAVSAQHPATMSWYDEPESDAKARPMLVHCSAGCGRTGTFCTVDSVIDMLKRQRLASPGSPTRVDGEGDVSMDDGPLSPRTASQTCDADGRKKARHYASGGIGSMEASWVGDNNLDLIESTVEDFRKQRLSMVQSLRQYVLCYESIAEWVWRLQDRSSGAIAGTGSGKIPSGGAYISLSIRIDDAFEDDENQH